MEPDFTRNNKYTRNYKTDSYSNTLGVERELRRFAMNEYLDQKDNTVLIGTDDNVVDDDAPEDELLLTNAITENHEQNEIDKKRYLKEVKSYITIHSASRMTQTMDITTIAGETLFSTGSTYQSLYPFAPYTLLTNSNGEVIVDDDNYFVALLSSNNHIQFKLQDWTNPNAVQQILNTNSSEIFDVYLNLSSKFNLDDLERNIDENINLVVPNQLSLGINQHMFTIEIIRYETINPDRASIKVSCLPDYRFVMIFFSSGDIAEPLIAEPIDASDASYVNQNPLNIYPYPNSYAISLNKAYTFVKSIKIISSEFPNTDTIINYTNNHITFQLIDTSIPTDESKSQNVVTSTGSIDWDIYIPYGNYKLDQLIDTIQTHIDNMLLGEADLKNILTINASNMNGIIDITVIDPYVFKWNFNANEQLRWRNLHDMLGFKNSYMPAYSTHFSNTITKKYGHNTLRVPYKNVNLKKSNIIWMQLNNYETIYDTYTKNYYFCRFNLDNVKNNQYAYDTFTPNILVFNDAPISMVDMVDVRLYDELGMPYNFNGIEHSFTLELTHFIDRLMGTDYSDKRGVNDKSFYV
jgi:hypothetical protein